MTELLRQFTRLKHENRKLLVPYVMGGIPDRFTFQDALHAVETDADAVEIGLPFTDPIMDGPVIAAAGERAIATGVGPLDALELAGRVEKSTLRVAMTYYNPIHRIGEREFCAIAAAAGFDGLIVPDLPVEESPSLRTAAAEEGLAWIPLVAPSSPPDRVSRIAATATGFVYAVSTLGVTGARASLSDRAAEVVAACREATDLPVLVGVGVSTVEQALEATSVADGVVIGTTVVNLILERGSGAAREFLRDVRSAMDRERL